MLPEMVQAIKQELEFYGKFGKGNYLPDTAISTVYFGGGTPSVLSIKDLDEILKTIHEHYIIESNIELTLEANPDNLTKEYCQSLKQLGVNRLSIGIQSFNDDHLKWMNRSHNEAQALTCVENALASQIDNLNVDLIYGFPLLSDDQWLQNLDIMQQMPLNHLSAYCLTVEDKTPLDKLIRTGRYAAPEEDSASRQFAMLMDWAKQNDWEQYEISNFCRNGAYSKHNTAYWQQQMYLGIGPSAHSYNRVSRHWNVNDNKAYVESWNTGIPASTLEILERKEQVNDLILTALRTIWGLNLNKLESLCGQAHWVAIQPTITQYVNAGLWLIDNGNLKLLDSGKYFADKLASELFITD
jgi:oxygen-independent coproporphyrinogen-3 oxidase